MRFTLATSHKSRSPVLLSKRDVGLTMLMGQSSWLRMPIHTDFVFSRKSHRRKLFQFPLEEKKLFAKVGNVPCFFSN